MKTNDELIKHVTKELTRIKMRHLCCYSNTRPELVSMNHHYNRGVSAGRIIALEYLLNQLEEKPDL